jgi:hypothetical protein
MEIVLIRVSERSDGTKRLTKTQVREEWRVELGNGSVNTQRPFGRLEEDGLWEKWNWRR